jgi:hypothetical protein
MSRRFLPVLVLLAPLGGAALAQAGPGTPVSQAVAPGAPIPMPGVQMPTDTAMPPVHTIAWILPGQTRSGQLEDGDYRMGDGTWCDIWWFQGAAGQRVTIELHSRAFDAYLQLLDPAGNKIAEDTDGAGNRDSRIVFTLREAGKFQIVVNNETDDVKTGPYSLILR